MLSLSPLLAKVAGVITAAVFPATNPDAELPDVVEIPVVKEAVVTAPPVAPGTKKTLITHVPAVQEMLARSPITSAAKGHAAVEKVED